ncbi:Protein of unknown function [Gryllus bimaculatus]|nr:Protein of unknown function [Gryllus bimaculatus]
MEQCSEISSWESRKKEDKAKGIFQELIFGTPLCEFRPTDSIRIVNASIRSRGSNPVDVGSMMKSNTKKFGCRKDPKNRSWRSPCLPTNPIFAEKLEISPHLGLEVENDHDSVDVRLGSLEDAVTPEPAPFSSAFAERFTLDWTTEKTSIRCRSH